MSLISLILFSCSLTEKIQSMTKTAFSLKFENTMCKRFLKRLASLKFKKHKPERKKLPLLLTDDNRRCQIVLINMLLSS